MSPGGPAEPGPAEEKAPGPRESHGLSAGIEVLVRAALGGVFTAAQLEVRWRGRPLLSGAWGGLDPEGRGGPPCEAATRFDLASVTKLFTTAAFLRLVEAGRVGLDDPVAKVLPEFSGPRGLEAYEDPARPGAFLDLRCAPPPGAGAVGGLGAAVPGAVPEGIAAEEAARVAFRALLSHSSGLPPWLPLARTGSPEAARAAALASPFAYPPGTRVAYSDIGFILLGLSVERLAGRPLDAALAELVLGPLGLVETGYRPLAAWPTEAGSPCFAAGGPGRVADPGPGATAPPAFAPTERCPWRGRRLVGEVHDENASALLGVSGHAGLFSTAREVAAFGQALLGPPPGFLSPALLAEACRLQAAEGAMRRGLGFQLWSPDPEGASNPFGPDCFGHSGFTGTSLWIDPGRDLVVACLTNRVHGGRDPKGIIAFRSALHRLLAAEVDRAVPG